MADTEIVGAELGDKVDYRQTTEPRTKYGEFVADDTDYHALELGMRTQGGLTYAAENLSDKDMTITLYGAFEAGKDVATDTDVFAIDDVGLVVAAGETAYEDTGDKFPYYIIRCKFAAVPDGSTVTIYAQSRES